MADTKMMASAVALPEDSSEESPRQNGLKRRQSEASEQESKRQRTSPGKDSPQAAPKEDEEGHPEEKAQPEDHSVKPPQKAEDTREARRKSGVTDEKQRTKRLFGALLGNLNRPGDKVSKRRSEIESRRKAELQKQDDERLEDRQKRLEKLAAKRKREQINVDEQNMHMRHKNMMTAAGYLQTRTEPKLYYKPWDLRTDEEDRIDDQIKDTQDQIDKELADWQDEKQRRLDSLNASEGDSTDKPSEAKSTKDATQDELPDQPAAPEGESSGGITEKQADEGPSANTTEKLAEVPESDLGEQTNRGAPDESKDAEQAKPEESKPEEGKADEPTEEKKDDNDDEGDHVVEGDEDTVIY